LSNTNQLLKSLGSCGKNDALLHILANETFSKDDVTGFNPAWFGHYGFLEDEGLSVMRMRSICGVHLLAGAEYSLLTNLTNISINLSVVVPPSSSTSSCQRSMSSN
jgi:hypothetical protein